MPAILRKDGARLRIRLTPKAARNEIGGIGHDPNGQAHLKVKVTAAPEKGKANKALVKLLAKELRLPPTAFDVVSGTTSRAKEVLVKGDDNAMMATLQTWLEETYEH